MKLDNNYTITPDAHCWVLHYREVRGVNESTGRPRVSTDEWYLPNLKAALKKYMDISLKGADSVGELMKRLNEVEQKIDKIDVKNK